MRFTIFFVSILLISCDGKPTKGSCDFEFFENTSNVIFPENLEIINCDDSLEGDIWVHLQFSKNDINGFMNKLDFHSYSDKAEYIESDMDKILPFYPDNDAIDTFVFYMNNKYVEIPKTEFTYIATISKEEQFVTYIINKKSGLFWGHIGYPDWSGDF
jgi:hypothetical protein